MREVNRWAALVILAASAFFGCMRTYYTNPRYIREAVKPGEEELHVSAIRDDAREVSVRLDLSDDVTPVDSSSGEPIGLEVPISLIASSDLEGLTPESTLKFRGPPGLRRFHAGIALVSTGLAFGAGAVLVVVPCIGGCGWDGLLNVFVALLLTVPALGLTAVGIPLTISGGVKASRTVTYLDEEPL